VADITESGNIDADPLFVGGGDYHLATGSPCIDAGMTTAVTDDIDGDARPQGSAYDIGFDEYVPVGPSICLSKSVMNNSCQAGTNAVSQAFRVWSCAGPTLSYSITDDVDWLSCSPATGTSDGNTDKDVITVNYSTSGLTAGSYTATITVSDPNAENDPQTIAVNLTVTPAPITVSFASLAGRDGTVLESSEDSSVGGTFDSTAAISTALRMGDDYLNATLGECQYKAIVTFNTKSIPDDATIVSATLKLTGGGMAGTNPLSTHGLCYVDVKNGYFGSSSLLENADFEAAATATQVATMSAPSPGSPVSTGNLNAAGLAAISLTGYTQMRIYFSTDDNDDNNDDYVEIGRASCRERV